MEKPTTALAVSGARQLITSQQAYEQQLQAWQTEHVHALCPMLDFGALPEQYALVPAKVKIDANPTMGEVYFNAQFCKPGEVALSALALQKLAACAGISLYTERTDPRNIAHYWEFRAVASQTGLDGAKQTRTATKEWDLRDGSDQLKGFTPKQISEARKHGGRNAETRAINAVIRQLGIKQKYTVEELQKPFGLVRVVYQPNLADPVTRAIVAQNALGGAQAFAYPGAPPAGLGAGHVLEGELAEPEASSAAPTPAAEPDFDEVPSTVTAQAEPPKRYSVTTVQKEKIGDVQRYYVLTAETGEQRLHTEDESLARLALKAKGQGPIIELELQAKGEQAWILELRATPAASPSPTLAGPTLPTGACYVEQIEEKSGTAKKSGKPWTLFTITFSTGEQGTTFSETIAKTAAEAKAGRLPVKATLEENAQYPDSQTVTALTIIDTRQTSFLESEL